MGQKANPVSLRLGINRDWNSKWYAPDKKTWSLWLVQDKQIRKYLDQFTKKWSLSNIIIERDPKNIIVTINTVKPGVVLGEEGKNVAVIQKEISKILKDKKIKIEIKVANVKNADLDAKILANEIASSLENRVSFRVAQKRVIQRAMKAGAKGVKTQVSGRLNGVDMARAEGYSEGVVPQQTFRNDLDYAIAQAHTTYGVIGVKVWVSKGELLKIKNKKNDTDYESIIKEEPKKEVSKVAKKPATDKKEVKEIKETKEVKVIKEQKVEVKENNTKEEGAE